MLSGCVALLVASVAGAAYYVAWNTHRTANRLHTATVLLNRVNAAGEENIRRQMAFLLAQDIADTADDCLLFRTTAFRAKIVQAVAVIGDPPYFSGMPQTNAQTAQDIHAVVAAYEKVAMENEAAMRRWLGGRLWLSMWKIAPERMTAAEIASPIAPNARFSVARLWNTSGVNVLLAGNSTLLELGLCALLVGCGMLYWRYRKSPGEFSDELRLRLCFCKKGDWLKLNAWLRRAFIVIGCITFAWFVAWALRTAFPCAMRLPFLFLHGFFAVAIPFALVAYCVFLLKTPALFRHPTATRLWVVFYALSYIVAAVGFSIYQCAVFGIAGSNLRVLEF